MPDCSVRGPRFESPHGWLCFMTAIAIYSLGQGLCILTALPRSTQPCTRCGTVKWVSAFRLSNNNKCRWWMWIVAAYWRTHTSTSALNCAKVAEPIGLPFSSLGCGLGWVEGSTSWIVFICQVAPMCTHGRAHCHNLASTIEPSVCSRDAALCQITLNLLWILLLLSTKVIFLPAYSSYRKKAG